MAETDEWSFLKKDLTEPLTDLSLKERFEKIVSDYAALGPRHMFGRESIELKETIDEIEPLMRERIIKERHNPFANYKAVPSLQCYGIPGDNRTTTALENYCKNAFEFLHSRLSGLDKHEIDWTIVKEGDDFEKDFNKRGYIVDSFYMVRRVLVLENLNSCFDINSIKYQRGSALTYDIDSETNKKTGWYIIISADFHALQGAFSEVIHLTTSKRKNEYAEGKDPDRSVEANDVEESLVEGISHLLSLDFVRELDIPHGVEALELLARNIEDIPEYEYMKPVLNWTEEHGIQAAFDAYMESPGKFLELVGVGK